MKANEHKRRRRQLMRMMEPKSIAILPAATERIRNRDVHYPYRQDSDFHYLTGFPEPEAVAVLIPRRSHGEYVLFCREKDATKELWDGPRAGQEGAIEDFGADDSFPISDLDEILPRMLEQCERVYYAMGCDADLDRRMSEWINRIRSRGRTGVHAPIEFIALDHYLHELRLIKSPAEIRFMRKAARISAQAHIRTMQSCSAGMNEYQVQADFEHECMHQGAMRQAYPAIVGGGPNACVLHYTDNSATLADGEMVLIDAGCEYDHYASDITRTFPISGRFSDPQRTLYAIVLEAQLAAIDTIQPGAHWNEPHEAAVKVITRGLRKIGLLKGTVPRLVKDEAYKPFFPHRTGHWLGMDVHDVGDYKIDGEWRQLEPGMALTVEPGIYIPPGMKGVARKWWGIGIRIEDDVLVTRDGHEVMSSSAPKGIAEIEALMAGEPHGDKRKG